MAIYKPNPGADPFIRKIAFSKFSQNVNSSYLCNNMRPFRKRTALQSISRSMFAEVTTGWRLMNNGQHFSFDSKVPLFPRYNSLGQVYYMSGQNLQTGNNKNLLQAGLPKAVKGYSPIGFSSRNFSSYASSYSPFTLQYLLNNNSVPTNVRHRVFCTEFQLTTNQPTWPSDYRFVQQFTNGSYPSFNITDAYIAAFGSPPPGPEPPIDFYYTFILIQALSIVSGEQIILCEGMFQTA